MATETDTATVTTPETGAATAETTTTATEAPRGRGQGQGQGRGGDRRGQGRGGPRGRGRDAGAPKEFEEVIISVDRVTRVVSGGRRLRYRAIVAIGDRKGRVGVGTGKSVDTTEAVAKATRDAKKRLVHVPVFGGTIPHQVRTKYAAADILLQPASVGTGIIAGGVVRTLADLAGITDVLSKRFGSVNKLNNCRATLQAFSQLAKSPLQWHQKRIAKAEELTAAAKPTAREDAKPEQKRNDRRPARGNGGRPAPRGDKKPSAEA